MKKETIRRWLQGVMIVAALVTSFACTNNEIMDADMPTAKPDTTLLAVYEGDWTVKKQVVDTARLVVGQTMRVRLPEPYLLELCTLNVSGTAIVEPQGVEAEIVLNEQGYSEHSLYLTFASETYQDGSNGVRFILGSFYAIADGTRYRISLLGKENAVAVMQKDEDQWILGIPFSAFLITNVETGQRDIQELPVTVNLYYCTRKRTK